MSPDKLESLLDPIKNGFLTFLEAKAQINTSLLAKQTPFDDNNIIVRESISVLAPSSTPLGGKILFPTAKPEARLDLAENRPRKSGCPHQTDD